MTQSAFGVILPIVNSTNKILVSFGSPQAGSRLLRTLPNGAERIDDLQMDHRRKQVN